MISSDLSELTERIIGCAYNVSNNLGIGFVEKVYENAFAIELRAAGLKGIQQFPIKVHYRDAIVGEFFADLLVEDQVLVELKAVTDIDSNHLAQALNYLRASKHCICLLINFGKPRIQIRSLKPSPKWKNT